MITHLPDHATIEEPPSLAGPDHPMRVVTRAAAFDNDWSTETASFVQGLFDDMAPSWNEGRDGPTRRLALEDALDRGEVPDPGVVLELGSGTGLGTAVLSQRFGGRVVAMDLALDMLRNAPAQLGARAQADASRLPVATDSVDLVVLLNALLFPSEVDRVLSPQGAVVWVNSLGTRTPIHLPAEDVAEALPGAWHGVASRAGMGTWAVVRRQ